MASRAASPTPGTPKKVGTAAKNTTPSQPRQSAAVDQREFDIAGLNISDDKPVALEEIPKVSISREKLLEQIAQSLLEQESTGKSPISLVVIGRCLPQEILTYSDPGIQGHVDAGKSTLMGRLLYDLGRIEEKQRIANERGSDRMGKSSFSWAWQLDGTLEERQRYGISEHIVELQLTVFTAA
jgi:elongation factor 1 alpha-like protein